MIRKIGTTVYMVHKSYVDQKKNNGKIKVGKIRSYQNIDGVICPIIKEVGSSVILDPLMNYIYESIELAIDAIRGPEPVKSKTKKK